MEEKRKFWGKGSGLILFIFFTIVIFEFLLFHFSNQIASFVAGSSYNCFTEWHRHGVDIRCFDALSEQENYYLGIAFMSFFPMMGPILLASLIAWVYEKFRKKKKVVFICKGNMHRSPTAEALYNLLETDGSHAESYGTWVEKEGRTGKKLSSFPSLLKFIEDFGREYVVYIGDHVCTQVTPKVLEGADKIIVIAEEYSIPDWLRKYKYEHWNLPDKDDMSHEEIIADIKGIKEKVETLL